MRGATEYSWATERVPLRICNLGADVMNWPGIGLQKARNHSFFASSRIFGTEDPAIASHFRQRAAPATKANPKARQFLARTCSTRRVLRPARTLRRDNASKRFTRTEQFARFCENNGFAFIASRKFEPIWIGEKTSSQRLQVPAAR